MAVADRRHIDKTRYIVNDRFMTLTLSATVLRGEADQRRARILDGAMGCFLAYGYQRASMDDIAKAAEISRPALYLQFRNKAEIYRALTSAFVDHALQTAEAAFAEEGDLETRLAAALSCVMDLVGAVEAFPHGGEILDMKSSLAADLVAQGRGRMAGMIEQAIAKKNDRTQFEPRLYADMLLDAIDGMKLRLPLPADQTRLKDSYIAILMAALR